MGLNIAFFGSSLVSSYWNGAATYYRGIVKALHAHGHRVTFYEPNAYDRQNHRDIADPEWARVVVYEVHDDSEVMRALEEAQRADLVIKASGVGVFDELLERAVLDLRNLRNAVVFWDVDAPATLDRVHGDAADPFLDCIPRYDLILTYGGGDQVIDAYHKLGARKCVPIYNALDPTVHQRVAPDPRYEGLLGFMASRLPDREQRVHEFFLQVAEALPDQRFVLGGTGWSERALPDNVRAVGHVYGREHNAFNSTPRAILNVNRESMARYGFSPPTRIFEAAGAGACLLSDRWQGIELFLEPDSELLVVDDGTSVVSELQRLDEARARAIGRAAQRAVLAHHTYDHRSALLLSTISALTQRAHAAPERQLAR